MKVIIPILLFLMALLPGFGQETVTLSGFIRTPCGNPIPGVGVLEAITDSNGFYSVELQQEEDYSVAYKLLLQISTIQAAFPPWIW